MSFPFRYFPVLTLLVALAVGAAGSPAAHAHGLALVMNSGEASLSIVDMDTHREVRRIPVLREPHHWALTPDRRGLLVGDTAGNVLFDLDPTTFALRRQVPVADPYQLGFSPDGKFLTVNGNGRNQVDIYDGATLKLVKRFPLARTPSHLDYAPDGSHVYVSLQDTDRLVSIDLRTLTVQWDEKVGRVPAGVLWLNGRVLVALMNDEGFAVVDPATGHVERRVHTAAGAHQLFLSPDRKILWVNNRVAGTTVALDAATLAEIRSYRVSGGPDDIAFAPDGKLWITQRFVRTVAVLDPATGHIETIEVGRQPHGIFLNPNADAATLSASN
jgi:DNA-binding beta-propeller fold protein YncE